MLLLLVLVLVSVVAGVAVNIGVGGGGGVGGGVFGVVVVVDYGVVVVGDGGNVVVAGVGGCRRSSATRWCHTCKVFRPRTSMSSTNCFFPLSFFSFLRNRQVPVSTYC